MPKSSPLGSLSVQAPSESPQVVRVTPSTCRDLSLFKELLKEYRRLDDTIVMRLNRVNAQFLDRERMGKTGKGSLQDQSCAYIWQELVGNWKRRTEIIEYCVGVVDHEIDEKRALMDSQGEDTTAQRKIKAALYSAEAKRNQVHSELTVEKIVRQRCLDAFRSRCKYFEPPESSPDRSLWDHARSDGQ